LGPHHNFTAGGLELLLKIVVYETDSKDVVGLNEVASSTGKG